MRLCRPLERYISFIRWHVSIRPGLTHLLGRYSLTPAWGNQFIDWRYTPMRRLARSCTLSRPALFRRPLLCPTTGCLHSKAPSTRESPAGPNSLNRGNGKQRTVFSPSAARTRPSPWRPPLRIPADCLIQTDVRVLSLRQNGPTSAILFRAHNRTAMPMFCGITTRLRCFSCSTIPRRPCEGSASRRQGAVQARHLVHAQNRRRWQNDLGQNVARRNGTNPTGNPDTR